MTEIILITGFLGSGKTTLLKRILEEYSAHYKIAVIQNEYSDASPDSTELSLTKLRFQLVELNKGSIFCICLYADFTFQLERLVSENKPEFIFIEASGIADPIAVAALFNNNPNFFLSTIITVVDPFLFSKMSGYVKSVNNQIRVADLVIINKTDKYPYTLLETTTKKIAEINPTSEIISTSFCHITDLLTSLSKISKKYLENRQRDVYETSPHQKDSSIFSHVFKTTKKVEKQHLTNISNSIPDYILRMKGFAVCSDNTTYNIQYVFGDERAVLHKCPDLTATEIVAVATQDPTEFLNKYVNGGQFSIVQSPETE